MLNDIPRSLFTMIHLLGFLIILVAGACSGDADGSRFSTELSTAEDVADATTKVSDQADSSELSSGKIVEGFPFPTGPVSVVATDFNPPRDRVDSTGAYLPVNGKPTLVFVDSIW